MTTTHPAEVSGRLWTVSNGFSMLRMLMAVPVAYLLFQTPVPRGTVFVLCWAAYATDLLDGWIARRFGQESNIGRVIDPLADKVYIAGMVLAMLVQGMIPVWFVVLVLVRDVTIFLAGIYLRKRTGVLVQSNYTGKAAVVTIGFTLLMALYRADVSDAVFAGMLALSVAMQAASLVGYGKRFHSLITTSRND
ncbi:MAG: CDP-alcohol phosphatidyltransferase family protein [Ignavibacteria bacterium]|nr:CDP-alcohol phosphatidyltransferase family protein [Ignavibacteria bacterium]